MAAWKRGKNKEMDTEIEFLYWIPSITRKTSTQSIYFNIDIMFDLFLAACSVWNEHSSHFQMRPASLFVLVKDFVTNYKFHIVPGKKFTELQEYR